jgi:protein AroM
MVAERSGVAGAPIVCRVEKGRFDAAPIATGIFGRAADHQPGDEDRDNRGQQHSIEARPDAAEDDRVEPDVKKPVARGAAERRDGGVRNTGSAVMRERVLGTLTIGQAPRLDVIPIIDRHVPTEVRRVHRGVLDGLSPGEIAARYRPAPGEAVLVSRLSDGSEVELSRRRMREGVQQALLALEAEGCAVILLLCTGTFEGLECRSAWLVEPDHIIPGMVAGLVERRQLGILVPIAGQIETEAGKWAGLARRPIFAAASPYTSAPEAVCAAGAALISRGAAALLLDCIGFTERHRTALLPLGLPVILSNAVIAKAVGELFGG